MPETLHPGVRRATIAAAALLLVLFAARAVLSLREKSLTVDESIHVPSGLLILREGDFRISPEHPPLGKAIAALPLLFLDLDLALDHPSFEAARSNVSEQWAWSRVFLYERNAPNLRRITLLSRLPMVLLGVLLGLVVFLFARDLFGERPALLALALATLCPNLLAHARLATTDLPVTLGIAFAVWRFERFCRAQSRLDFALASIGAAFALATKFTGLLLLPLLPALGFLAGAGTRRPRLLLAGLAIAALGLVLSWTGYGLVPRPDLYLCGLRSIYAGHVEGTSYFLLGRYSEDGFRLYYPIAIALKTPLATLALGLAGLVACRRAGRRAAFVWAPIALVVAASAVATRQIGVRHALPAVPFLLAAPAALALEPWMRSLAARAACSLLVAWAAVSSLAVHPHYLAYFNEIAGGPARGIAALDDSNVDWGEDLDGLAAFVRERGIDSIGVSYFGPRDPTVKRPPMRPVQPVEMILPRDGWYAVSAHFLQRDRPIGLGSAIRFRWLERYSPVAVIGHSIYVYRFRIVSDSSEAASPPLEGTVIAERDLLRQAEADCLAALERFPEDPYATYFLGTVRKRQGLPAEALRHYGRALALAPDQEGWWFNYGRTALDAADLEIAEQALEEAAKRAPDAGEVRALAADALARRMEEGGADPERLARLRAHAAAARALGTPLSKRVQAFLAR